MAEPERLPSQKEQHPNRYRPGPGAFRSDAGWEFEWVCNHCGSVVIDTVIHDSWHKMLGWVTASSASQVLRAADDKASGEQS